MRRKKVTSAAIVVVVVIVCSACNIKRCRLPFEIRKMGSEGINSMQEHKEVQGLLQALPELILFGIV